LVYNRTASGYNAAADLGGTDILIEFDQASNVIRVYEQNPGPKTLIETISYPWSAKTGVNFKYSTKHSVGFSCCGVINKKQI
jgi:hypothetical protein